MACIACGSNEVRENHVCPTVDGPCYLKIQSLQSQLEEREEEIKELVEVLEYYQALDNGENPLDLPPKTIVPCAAQILKWLKAKHAKREQK